MNILPTGEIPKPPRCKLVYGNDESAHQCIRDVISGYQFVKEFEVFSPIVKVSIYIANRNISII